LPHVYNDGKIIIPLDDDHYWVGSNYEWKTLDTVPTEKVKEDLIAFLDKTLKVRYDIVDHAAQVRPSSYNRRPFVGRHPEHPNYYILNGLGTKGASLAPYCAEQLIGYILEGADLDEEIDVSRVHLRQDFGG
jgi:glycine/D-amino acid oxidase-like deaminating enzyme